MPPNLPSGPHSRNKKEKRKGGEGGGRRGGGGTLSSPSFVRLSPIAQDFFFHFLMRILKSSMDKNTIVNRKYSFIFQKIIRNHPRAMSAHVHRVCRTLVEINTIILSKT